jgi:hypothetical protein
VVVVNLIDRFRFRIFHGLSEQGAGDQQASDSENCWHNNGPIENPGEHKTAPTTSGQDRIVSQL